MKDYFQGSIQETGRLREEYFKISDYLDRGKYKMRLKYFPGGQQHYDFDMNSQEYFHEHLDEIIFEVPETQEHFYDNFIQSMEQELNINIQPSSTAQTAANRCQSGLNNSPRCVKELLLNHFQWRVKHLQHKKYNTLLRFHNQLPITLDTLKSLEGRIRLIDTEIQACISRKTLLEAEDLFEECYGVARPVPINDQGQQTYRLLDQQQSWYSNISRDDIEVYLRNKGFWNNILRKVYWPVYYQIKHVYLNSPASILHETQIYIQEATKQQIRATEALGQELVAFVEAELGKVAPGNVAIKENATLFLQYIYGLHETKPLTLPLLPCFVGELIRCLQHAASHNLKDVEVNQDNKSMLVTKINNFVAIVHKYQNKQILLEEEPVRLELDDDMDFRKELCTMLEQSWVTRHLDMDSKRFQIRLYLQTSDWPNKESLKSSSKIDENVPVDTQLQTIMGHIANNDYHTWRKFLKEHSELVTRRAKNKFTDAAKCRKYELTSSQDLTLGYLNNLFRTKNSHPSTQVLPILKSSSAEALQLIISRNEVKQPVIVEAYMGLMAVELRELRSRLRNLLNASRCYFKRICYDQRPITLADFKYELDDRLLVDSSKQERDVFEKLIKESPATFSVTRADGSKNEEISIMDMTNNKLFKDKSLHIYDRVVIETHHGRKDYFVCSPVFSKKKYIMYDITLKDLEELENRLLMCGSSFVNKFEGYLKVKNHPELVDRYALLVQLYKLQLSYQTNKFELLEVYMNMYQHTCDPLDCFKLSKTIEELLSSVPKIDYAQPHFRLSYETEIEKLQVQIQLLQRMSKSLKQAEINEVNYFHKRLKRTIDIPYFRYAYYYGELDPPEVYKLKKNASVSSISSSKSKNSQPPLSKQNTLTYQIVDEQLEVYEDDGLSQQSALLQIANYDEYLLARNLDEVFDQIAKQREEGAASPINKAGSQTNVKEQGNIENKVVHRRFEGGPHFLLTLKDFGKVALSGSEKIEYLNFYEMCHWAANIPKLLEEIQESIKLSARFCSHIYQSSLALVLLRRALNIVTNPEMQPNTDSDLNYNWDDCYQRVVQDSRFYKEIIHPCVQSVGMSALAHNHQLSKVIQGLPTFEKLQHLDLHNIECLTQLKKPSNLISYRQLSLAINLLNVFMLDSKLFHISLEREELCNIYKELGRQLGLEISIYGSIYIKHSNSAFKSIQQLKQTLDFKYGLVYGDSVEQLRTVALCEGAELENLRSFVKIQREKVLLFQRMDKQLQFASKYRAFYLNSVVGQDRVSLDSGNIRVLNQRVASLLSSKAAVLREQSYIKSKAPLKSLFERKLVEANVLIFQQNQNSSKDKAAQYVLEKKSRLIRNHLLQLYAKDLLATAEKRNSTIDLLDYARVLSLITQALPFSSIWQSPDCHHYLEQKFYFDQKNYKVQIKPFDKVFDSEMKIINPLYIYSQEQILDEHAQPTIQSVLDQFIPAQYADILFQYKPPSRKQEVLKWFFKQNDKGLQPHQVKSLRHLLRLNKPFSGTKEFHERHIMDLTVQSSNPLVDYYKALLSYIESALFTELLASEDMDLFLEMLEEQRNFEKLFPILDSNELYEHLEENVLASMYLYEIREFEILKKTKSSLAAQRDIKARNQLVLEETLDFLTRRVQGLGLLREEFLPIVEQTLNLKKVLLNSKDHSVLLTRAKNTYKTVYLGLLQFYRNTSKLEESKGVVSNIFKLYNDLFSTHTLTEVPHLHARAIDINSYFTEDQEERYRYCNKVGESQPGIFPRLTNILINHPSSLEKYLTTVLLHRPYHSPGHITALDSLGLSQRFMRMVRILSQWQLKDRHRLLARVKNAYEKSTEYLQLKNLGRRDLLKGEPARMDYLNMEVQTASYMTALVNLENNIFQPVDSGEYSKFYFQIFDRVDFKAVAMVNNFEAYISSEKLQLTKQEKLFIISPLNLSNPKENQKERDVNNRVIRQVLLNKLIREEFKVKLLQACVKMIHSERFPHNESKKLINPSLVPRVKLNSCFSSPLIIDRKTYISQQYKLAFVQAFVNRFRNKVSRVDLLSSGYGFVITVSDLENCVNFLNKSLFSFTEKEFKHRSETFSQLHELMLEAVNLKNKEICELKAKVDYLKAQLNKSVKTAFVQQVNNLLLENTNLRTQLQDLEKHTRGLEDRVRKAVALEFEQRLQTSEQQLQAMAKKYIEFKDLLVILTKAETKSSFLFLIDDLKQRASALLDRTLDFFPDSHKAQAYKEEQALINNTSGIRVKEHPYENNTPNIPNTASPQDEALIHDPYYVTKLINKMRIFNAFKLGAVKLRQAKENQKLQQNLGKLSAVHDTNVIQTEKQMVLREELSRLQLNLTAKTAQLDNWKSKCETLQNEKARLKIQNLSKEKKLIQQQELSTQRLAEEQQTQTAKTKHTLPEIPSGRESQEPRDHPSNHHNTPSSSHNRLHRSVPKTLLEAQPSPMMPESILAATLRNKERAKIKMLDSSRLSNMYATQPLILENSPASLMMVQMANKDQGWKEKCEELFIENKNLEKLLEKCRQELATMRSSAVSNSSDAMDSGLRQGLYSSSQRRRESGNPDIREISATMHLGRSRGGQSREGSSNGGKDLQSSDYTSGYGSELNTQRRKRFTNVGFKFRHH